MATDSNLTLLIRIHLYSIQVMEYKSHLCVRMLEKAIGAEQLLQVLNKQLSLAVTAAQPGSNPKLWPNMVINTLSFKHSIFMVTGKDMGVFIDKWIRSGGHAQFHMDFFFNRKRNTVEMNITQVGILLTSVLHSCAIEIRDLRFEICIKYTCGEATCLQILPFYEKFYI